MARTRVDARRCTHDSVGGETVVIDTTTGRLLMITGFGSPLWDALGAGADLAAVDVEVRARYGADAAVALADFVERLRGSGYLVDDTDGSRDGVPGAALDWPAAFVPPGVETYTEIAEIMTMDPIHEVDTTLGWPRPGGDHPPTA